jgi:AcrR family transcriptional regulator
MEDIATEAAVSTATLYRYFPSKLSLFEAVLRDGLADFDAALAEAASLEPKPRLTRLTRAYAELLDDPVHAGVLRAVLTAAPASPEVTRMFYTHVKTVVAGAFHASVDAARRAKLVRRGAPADAGGQLMGMIEHATLWRRLLTGEAGDKPPPAIANDALKTFWAAWGADRGEAS